MHHVAPDEGINLRNRIALAVVEILLEVGTGLPGLCPLRAAAGQDLRGERGCSYESFG